MTALPTNLPSRKAAASRNLPLELWTTTSLANDFYFTRQEAEAGLAEGRRANPRRRRDGRRGRRRSPGRAGTTALASPPPPPHRPRGRPSEWTGALKS